MEELINQIKNRTGISEDQARQAVTTVLDFARTRLPDPIVTQLEQALNTGTASDIASQVSQHIGSLSGLFGKNNK